MLFRVRLGLLFVVVMVDIVSFGVEVLKLMIIILISRVGMFRCFVVVVVFLINLLVF